MRHLLALLALVSAVVCLPLEPLCPADHFDYPESGVRVNAIYRLPMNVTLPVSDFAIPVNDNCLNLPVFNDVWASLSIKSQAEELMNNYNRLMIRLFSERFLNSKDLDANSLVKQLNDTNELVQQITRIYAGQGEIVKPCLEVNVIPKMKGGPELIKHLASLQAEQLPQTDENGLKLGKAAVLAKLESEIARISNDVTDSQTMAFHSELIPDVYKKRIVRMGKFVLLKKSKIVFNLNSEGVVNFNVIFPFQDTALQAGKDCVSKATLPEFFATQGKIVKAPGGSSTTPATA